MVMSLPPPGTCSLQLVDDVVAERQGGVNWGFFSGIKDEWRQRVHAYIDAKGSPAVVPTWPAVDHKKVTFQNLYKSPAEGSAQGIALKQLRAHGLVLCPACGEAGAPNTLDHYLPKTSYPHFAVTPYNLFPMCDACQHRKGTKTGDATDPRYFIHPYFDAFAVVQLFELSIAPPFDAPTFALSAVGTLPADQLALVQAHMRELEIADRYSHFFRDQHRRLLRLVSDLRSSGQNVVESLETFRNYVGLNSLNAWEHVFYAGVLNNPDLMAYLCNDDLPDFL